MKSSVAILIIAATAACQKSPAAPAEDPAFVIARDAVIATFKDPDSAKFSSLVHGKPGFVCGAVNSKNGFGGYTGSRAFSYATSGDQQRVLMYDYNSASTGEWDIKGQIAARFAERGCSVGVDQEKAVKAVQAMRAAGMYLRSAS